MNKVIAITSALRRVCLASSLLAGLVLLAAPASQASTGTDHGYYWSLYVSSGSANITFPEAGTYAGNYAITWSGVGDMVGGKGWSTGSAQTIGYNCGSISGFNNFSIYGWTTNPLIEYYICEMGSVTYAATYVGSLSSDGRTYGVYKHQQVNQPSIQGTATFWQYLSNWGGASTGTNYSVTTGNHFNYWKAHIGSMGAFNYQILATEAYNGASGSVNATVW